MLKRMFDLIISLGLLVISSPILIVSYLLISKKLGKPVLFKQTRPGKYEKPFDIYKFRTMTTEVDGKGQLLPDEQRMTKLGSQIRNSSIDELPQLINVLKGDLSLVGPRPLLMEYLPLYNEEQKKRHNVKPGITGWAQINGRNAITWEQKFKLDVWYAENQSFKLDMYILYKTIENVLKKKNISSESHVTAEKFRGNF
ncbi:sugar transferase [Staphylococcus arlettae]|uniref:sugar transferase n=1 Tax=Staphylococcus TaxID=1279 RepID=UPI001072AA72|nr:MULTISPECIES: sugar transferase [Staphylococcus]MBF0737771.1 sugar transferase [Staphylococcus arlettae]MBK3720494.1 putative sugar transferase EpsL [Staphylococcus arlettae]MDT3925769.1 sugar transferase [Staphylococcus saprophyticus]MDW4231442.1 sugar transferase [Staphylococcus saprophyticus]MDW4406924.1 sugar transferase [Staphylococcus saprophyticus]